MPGRARCGSRLASTAAAPAGSSSVTPVARALVVARCTSCAPACSFLARYVVPWFLTGRAIEPGLGTRKTDLSARITCDGLNRLAPWSSSRRSLHRTGLCLRWRQGEGALLRWRSAALAHRHGNVNAADGLSISVRSGIVRLRAVSNRACVEGPRCWGFSRRGDVAGVSYGTRWAPRSPNALVPGRHARTNLSQMDNPSRRLRSRRFSREAPVPPLVIRHDLDGRVLRQLTGEVCAEPFTVTAEPSTDEATP